MASRTQRNQIAFRYRNSDSRTGVTRNTARRLAKHIGVDETQVIHMALHELAVRTLPQYEQDEGPLTGTQVKQIRKLAARDKKRSVRSSLFDTHSAG